MHSVLLLAEPYVDLVTIKVSRSLPLIVPNMKETLSPVSQYKQASKQTAIQFASEDEKISSSPPPSRVAETRDSGILSLFGPGRSQEGYTTNTHHSCLPAACRLPHGPDLWFPPPSLGVAHPVRLFPKDIFSSRTITAFVTCLLFIFSHFSSPTDVLTIPHLLQGCGGEWLLLHRKLCWGQKHWLVLLLCLWLLSLLWRPKFQSFFKTGESSFSRSES